MIALPTAALTAFCLVAMPLQISATVPLALVAEGAPSVDTSALGDMGKELAPKVAEAATPIVEEAGYDASTVRISIGWLNAEEFHYSVKVALDPKVPPDQAPLTATCRDCSSTQLVEAAVAGVRKAIEQRPEGPPSAATVGPDPAEVEPTPEVVPQSEPVEDKAPRKAGPLQPLGWAGVGTMIGGVLVLACGGAFLALGERRPADDMSQIRDFRPAGYGLLGGGGALLIAGAVMLGVERARSKKRANAAAILPWMGLGSAGVAWSGSF